MQMKHILGPWKWPLNQLFCYDNRPANAGFCLNLLQTKKDPALEIVSSFLLMPVWFLVACVLYVLESIQLGYSSCCNFLVCV